VGTVLDCAHGYQKENQQEVSKIEENRRQKVFGETASTKAQSSQEIKQEKSRSGEVRFQESLSQEESAGENTQK